MKSEASVYDCVVFFIIAGNTLLATACCSPLSDFLFDQVKYLIEKGADCTIKNTNSSSPLHHLAANSTL